MQFKNLSIGFWRTPEGKISWNSPIFEYCKCYEGCHILTIWILDISWLKGKCLNG